MQDSSQATLRSIDARFLLPHPPRTVALFGRWRQQERKFDAVGIDVHKPASGSWSAHRPDTAFCDTGSLQEAMKSDAPTIVVSGWIKRLNSRRVHPEWHSADYIVRKGARGPRWIATGDGAPRWHLAENWVSSRPWILRIRKALFTSRLAMAATSVRVLTRADTTVPYPLAIAARQMTFPVPAAWMVLFGDGSDRAKIVAFAFDDKARHPRWVVKFARTTWPEPEEDPHPWPLIRESETETLEILSRLAPHLATSATRRVGTVSIDGNDAAIEPAAPGSTLSAHLTAHHMATLPSVAHRVVEWAMEVGIATYDPEITAPDLDHWLGARRSVQAVEPIGSCVAHGDLSTLNIITDLSGFAIIDWETARPVGFPLLDVVTVCTDILVHRFGPLPKRERVDWVCSLWADELPQSAQCFTWLESAAASMGLSAEQASALVIAAWAYCLDEPDSGYRGSVQPEWMQHPKLGPMWSVESAASWQKANR